jgi:hypothetical protein
MRHLMSSLHPPFVHFVVTSVIPHCVGPSDSMAHRRGGALLLRPRGPRSGPGYSVPVRHRMLVSVRFIYSVDLLPPGLLFRWLF